MELTMAAITQSNRGPSPTRTRNPSPCIAKISGPFPDALPRNRNACWRDLDALFRRADARKDNAEMRTCHIAAPKPGVATIRKAFLLSPDRPLKD